MSDEEGADKLLKTAKSDANDELRVLKVKYKKLMKQNAKLKEEHEKDEKLIRSNKFNENFEQLLPAQADRQPSQSSKSSSDGVSVTWLELFWDLFVVTCIRNIAVPLEDDHDEMESILSYLFRVLLIWMVWHCVTMMMNHRKEQFDIPCVKPGTWLGWSTFFIMMLLAGFVTSMSNSSLKNDEVNFLGYFTLVLLVILLEILVYKLYIYYNDRKEARLVKKPEFLIMGYVFFLILGFSGIAPYLLIMENKKIVPPVKTALVVIFILLSSIFKCLIDRVTIIDTMNQEDWSGLRNILKIFSETDREHLAERYGLLVLLLLHEPVAVSAERVMSTSDFPQFRMALTCFITTVFCFYLYFAINPNGFEVLPRSRTESKNKDLSNLMMYSYAHIGIFTAIPMFTVGYQRLLEFGAPFGSSYKHKKDNDESIADGAEMMNEDNDLDEDKNINAKFDQVSSILLCMGISLFLISSGIILMFGKDPSPQRTAVPQKTLNQLQRGRVRVGIGFFLGVVALISYFIPCPQNAQHRIFDVLRYAGIFLLMVSIFVESVLQPNSAYNNGILKKLVESLCKIVRAGSSIVTRIVDQLNASVWGIDPSPLGDTLLDDRPSGDESS